MRVCVCVCVLRETDRQTDIQRGREGERETGRGCLKTNWRWTDRARDM